MTTADEVDPASVTTRDDIKRALACIRTRAEVTIREVAGKADVPFSTVGGYFSGRHLPTPAQFDQFVRILSVCGVCDPVEIESWLDAVRRVRRTLGRPAASTAPYRGLAAFQPEDSEWFFGRESLSQELLERIRERTEGPLMLVGPSGSGKSSLLRAGLAARMECVNDSEQWRCLVLTPGAEPQSALRRQLNAAATGEHILLVVDQFEELFTQCQVDEQRRSFLEALNSVPYPVVVGMRADFYAHALRYPQLSEALQRNQLVMRPMTDAELRRAITEPARKARVELDNGLVELLIRDLAPASGEGAAAHDAGALPLLSHTLLSTWDHGSKSRMSVEAYRATGGIQGAVAQTAESVYAGLSDPQQQVARRTFLRLVHIGEDTTDARRRAPRSELLGADGDADASIVLDEYVNQRLITTDADTVEISHEALLSAWPRLRSWIDNDRAGMRVHRQLTEATQAWLSLDRNPDARYRGIRLAAARNLAERGDWQALSTVGEREFLAASMELESTERRAAWRQARRMRRLAQALGALLVICLVVASVALVQRRRAVREQHIAQSRELALQAQELSATFPDAAQLLAVSAYRKAPTAEALGALLSTAAYKPPRAVFKDHRAAVRAVEFSADGKLLASAGSDRTVLLRNPFDGSPPVALKGHEAPVRTLAFHPDQRVLASAGDDARIILWDIHTHVPVTVLAVPHGRINSLEFSADGRFLVSGSHDGTVILWDTDRWAELTRVPHRLGEVNDIAVGDNGNLIGLAAESGALVFDRRNGASQVFHDHEGDVLTIALNRDGMLATGGKDSQIVLRDLKGRSAPAHLHRHFSAVRGLQFGPDRSLLLSASDDGSVRWWSVPSGGFLTGLINRSAAFNAAALSPDGLHVATGGDENVSIWPVALPRFTGHANPPNAVAFTADGTHIATAGPDRTIMVWDRDGSSREALPTSAIVVSLAFRPDGALVAADDNGTITVWDVSRHTALRTITGHQGSVTGLALTRQGELGASGGADGTIRIWDLARDTASRVLRGAHVGTVDAVAFNADGMLLASGGADGKIVLWDVAHDRQAAALRDDGDAVRGLAFTPDGRRLAVGDVSGTITVWDVSNRNRLIAMPGQRGSIRDLTINAHWTHGTSQCAGVRTSG